MTVTNFSETCRMFLACICEIERVFRAWRVGINLASPFAALLGDGWEEEGGFRTERQRADGTQRRKQREPREGAGLQPATRWIAKKGPRDEPRKRVYES